MSDNAARLLGDWRAKPDAHGRWTWDCPACKRLNVPVQEPTCVWCGTRDPLAADTPPTETPTVPGSPAGHGHPRATLGASSGPAPSAGSGEEQP